MEMVLFIGIQATGKSAFYLEKILSDSRSHQRRHAKDAAS